MTPNGRTLSFRMVGGVKVFHLIAEEVRHEFAPGLKARCWSYNGAVHGPTIEAVEGDQVRIYVTNRLPAPTSVHWHGLILPAGMDGVSGLTQPPTPPGETFRYEFTLRQNGTFMYHSHHDAMTQEGMGLTGLFVIHPKYAFTPTVDRDFAIMLHEWRIDPGTERPNTLEMTDFNVLTMNGKVFPATEPLSFAWASACASASPTFLHRTITPSTCMDLNSSKPRWTATAFQNLGRFEKSPHWSVSRKPAISSSSPTIQVIGFSTAI